MASSKFEQCDLVRATFRGSNLGLISFENSIVESCNFVDCNLSRSFFHSSTFKNCDFTNSTLTGSNFTVVKFINCNFTNSDLTGSAGIGDFIECDFSNAALEALDSHAVYENFIQIHKDEKRNYILYVHKTGQEPCFIAGCRSLPYEQAIEHWQDTQPEYVTAIKKWMSENKYT